MCNVSADGGMPDSDAIQVSPAAIGSEVVSVPVLMMSPAWSVSPPRRFKASLNSPTHAAGLLSAFFPAPSSISTLFFSSRTVKSASSVTSFSMFSGST